MREVMRADGVSALVVWMTTITMFVVFVIAALVVYVKRDVDRLRDEVDDLNEDMQELRGGNAGS